MAPTTRNHPNAHQDESLDVCNEDHRRALRDPEALVDATTQLFKAFTNGPAVYAGQAHWESKFDQFCHLHPPMFDGKADVMESDNWISRLEKIFQAINCTEEQMVEFATYNLADVADVWWIYTRKLIKQELGEESPITWTRFKQVFRDQFFPEVFREAKAREFADLRQGDMSIHQYALKFIELSRFAPYLIPDESRKAQKFERGLHPQILDRLIALKLGNFDALVDRAMILEEYLQSREEQFDKKKRKQQITEQSQSKKPFQSSGQKPPQNNKPQQKATGQHTTCQTCGKMHMGKCLMGTNTCFKCGKLGHLIQDCPQIRTPRCQDDQRCG
ncbi:uncharacterized protein LOC122292086 [Carya illinoinensis]|uniref:uncharacterized protein LOC122292086 n=1 Tax=Carya illinoinensis TaxID=32201 RepID=UPI001C7255B6|nr:uncharacterized protein LOC122292086 [Carya illinoinensis]XP_042956229.1 uncharacterized protein LOC122292086 [Carya illinoinensis]XP_042956230.1 uncharacterized protein LOC122292086 [Carya illinoinensis]